MLTIALYIAVAFYAVVIIAIIATLWRSRK